MNNYAPPLQGTANSLAKHGRYGDSMLVHMNPIEVQGIAALSPTGKLTTNPVTGQQEAFLPFLAPLLGGALGLSSLGTAALSGALTALQTGSLKKGLLAGITGFGLGKIMSAIPSGAGDALIPDAITPVAETVSTTSALADATSNIAESVMGAKDLSASVTSDLANASGNVFTDNVYNSNLFNPIDIQNAAQSTVGDLSGNFAGLENIASTPFEPAKQGFFSKNFLRDGRPNFSRIGELDLKKDVFPGLLMAGTAGSELGRLDAQEKLAAQLESDEMDASSDKAQSEEEIQRAINQRIYDYGMPSRGIDPLDSSYSPTAYANNGGLVSLNPMDYQNKRRGLAQLTGEPVRMANGGASPYPYGLGNYFGGQTGGYTPNVQASEAQSALRGSQLISAPQMQELYSSGYRPGFGPELQYFREPDQFGNDPFAGPIDPMNPNAAIIPTAEQLASLEEPPPDSNTETIDSSGNNGNYSFMPGKGNFVPPNIVESDTTVSDTGTTVDTDNTTSNPYQDFDFSALTSRLDALENASPYDDSQLRQDMNTRFGNFSNFDPSALQDQIGGLQTQIGDISQFDDSQLRQDMNTRFGNMNTRFGNFSNFDPSALQEQIASNQAAIQNAPQFDDTQLREDMNTRFGNFSNFDPSALQDQIAANQAAIQDAPQFDDAQLRQDINTRFGNMNTRFGNFSNFDPSGLQDRLAELESTEAPTYDDSQLREDMNTRFGNFSNFDPSQLQDRLAELESTEAPTYDDSQLRQDMNARFGNMNTRFGNIPQFDDSQLREEMNTRFGNIPQFDPTQLREEMNTRFGNIPQFDDSQLREEMNTRFGNFSNFDPSNLQSQISGLQDRQGFDPSALQSQIGDLQGKFGNFSNFDPSQLQGRLDELGGRIDNIPQFDDTQLRQDMNTRFGNFSNFDPSQLQERLNQLGGRVDNISQFDPSQLRDRLAELEERNMPRFGSDINNFRFNSGGITNLAEGGLVKMQDKGQVPEASIDPAMMQLNPMQEGIAAVDPAMADPAMVDPAIDPAALELMEQTAMAVLGQVPPEQADAIIQAFIQQFGSEAFQMLRQQVLASVEPNAQTEGMIEGQGDGMSDEIMGSIGDQQRVAVSPGEFIVPADVVSGIGNGSSDAGANELDSMMEEIRLARTGMAQQPPAIDPKGAMPV